MEEKYTRLQVRNVGTDARPDLRIFTEAGEEVIHVTSIKVDRPLGVPPAVEIKFTWWGPKEEKPA